jgi:hypothetical protein
MDRETFDIMWKMSSPGGEAEGCFMRVKGFMYLPEKHDESKPHPLSWMPEVGTSFSCYAEPERVSSSDMSRRMNYRKVLCPGSRSAQ